MDIINEVSMDLWVKAAQSSEGKRKIKALLTDILNQFSGKDFNKANKEANKDLKHALEVSQLEVPEDNPNALEYIKQCRKSIKDNPAENTIENMKVIVADPMKKLHDKDEVNQEELHKKANEIVNKYMRSSLENSFKDYKGTNKAGNEHNNAILDKKVGKMDNNESLISMSCELVDSIIECSGNCSKKKKKEDKFSTVNHKVTPVKNEDETDEVYEQFKQNNINLFNNTILLLESLISICEDETLKDKFTKYENLKKERENLLKQGEEARKAAAISGKPECDSWNKAIEAGKKKDEAENLMKNMKSSLENTAKNDVRTNLENTYKK